MPDADFLVAVAKDFATNATELDGAARAWEPTAQDAFTALVVMTPTMSEYFEAWKQSRFVAGAKSQETAFVAASRLQDIADILGGLVLVYEQVEPSIADADAQQAKQTGSELKELEQFAAQLRDEEAGGRKFTAREADTLGSDAQDRAEAIAGPGQPGRRPARHQAGELSEASRARPGGARGRAGRGAGGRRGARAVARRGRRCGTRCSTPRRS